MKRITADYDNIRLASEWALDKDGEMVLQMVGYLSAYTSELGYAVENRRWYNQAIELVESQPPIHGEAARREALAFGMTGLGIHEIVLGEYSAAVQSLEKSSDLWRQIGDLRNLSVALSLLSQVFALRGEFQQAFTAAEESITISQQTGNAFSLALAQLTLTIGLIFQKKYAQARAMIDQYIPVLRQRGRTLSLASATLCLAQCESYQGHYEQAEKYYDEAEEIFREAGDRHFSLIINSYRAEMEVARGDYPAATRLYQEIIQVWLELGNRGAIARCLECLAFIAGKEAEGQASFPEARLELLRKAGMLLGAAGAIRQVSQSARLPEEQDEYDQEIAQFKNLPEAEIFEAACAQGSRMTMEEATGYSLNEISSRV